MKKIKPLHITSLITLFILGCVKPYDFDPQGFDKVLVIDGSISNEAGPHSVEISYTYRVESQSIQKVNDARVWVIDQDMIQTDFAISESGIYLSPEEFQGQVGSTYQLFIELSDGRSFSSTQETLNASPQIDSIYAQYSRQPDEENRETVGGMQFFVDAASKDSGNKYLRYEWEEAHKIVVPYPAQFELSFGEEDTTIVPLEVPKGICYSENKSSEILFTSTLGTTENRVAEFPLRFIREDIRDLQNRYTLLARQYSISEEAFLFYKRLQENNDSGGSLFDQQQGSVFGNIASDEEDGESVLGFFEVAGVTEQRRFFSRRDLDERLDYPGYLASCYLSGQVATTSDSAYYYLVLTDGNIYGYDFSTEMIGIHTKTCTDCSYYADVVPPVYWED